MSGTAAVKTPKNNQEWARAQQTRVDQLEHPTSTRVGDWVLSTRVDTGDLLASHVDGGSITLAAKPAGSASPDDVSAVSATLRLERRTAQVEANGADHPVLWDTVPLLNGFSFTAGGGEIVIPEDGIYLIVYRLIYTNQQTSVTTVAGFTVDGVQRLFHEQGPSDYAAYRVQTVTDVLALSAGSRVTGTAYMSGSGTFSVGYATSNPNSYTSLSLVRQS